MAALPEAEGALEFARFAFPPNQLGLCGPQDSAELLELAAELSASPTTDSARLRQLAGGFEGAWPYLQVIAAANRLTDPLDPCVVRAYWIGNRLLDAVGPALGDDLDERFRGRAGRHWKGLAATLEQGARPHHNFHVFCVYPWVGLLRSGASDHALRVIDRCRIRWGRVVRVTDGSAVVSCRPLTWDGRTLALGVAVPEPVAWEHRGYRLAAPAQPGDVVALHWGWLVRALSAGEQQWLRGETTRHLAIANRQIAAAAITV